MPESAPIDWEAFYRNYRKPGYVPGFEILHKIGGGAFGLVFKARKESIAKDYAIKFLKVDDEAVRNAIASELDSVGLFAQVDHPNLVSIEDKGEVDGIPFIVMNWAGDATLRHRLEGGGMARQDALAIFVQVARGVHALHQHSLVHFDLKPGNVFLKGDIARVGDYGLSRLVTQSRNSLSFGRGTPYYMAPEMLQRRGDHRSDIYSLGVLLYECLTGTVPFTGDSEWEILRKHESELPRFPDSIGEPERSVLARCLAKEPQARFASVDELMTALQIGDGFTNAPGAAPRQPPPIPADAGEPTRRHRCGRPRGGRRAGRLVAALLAVLVSVGAAFALFAVRSSPTATWARSYEGGHDHAQADSQVAIITTSSRPSAKLDHHSAYDPHTLPTLAYPSGTSSSTVRRIERYVDKLLRTRDEGSRSKLTESLARFTAPTVVHTINRLRELDYHCPSDHQSAYALHGLLSRLTGKRADFALVQSSRSLTPSEIDRNARAVKQWWDYWRRQKKASR